MGSKFWIIKRRTFVMFEKKMFVEGFNKLLLFGRDRLLKKYIRSWFEYKSIIFYFGQGILKSLNDRIKSMSVNS